MFFYISSLMSDNRNSKSGMKGDYKVVNVWIILNVISKSRQLPAIHCTVKGSEI